MESIRLVNINDADALLAIYSPYIINTSLTFETEVPTTKAFVERIEKYLTMWPWLVYELNGEIAGYAYASQYRERIAYQWSVEVSVYTHHQFQRKGIARKLYSALFKLLQQLGYRNVYAVINLPNEPSVSFHESMGFQYFATYEKVGYKLGQWKNVGWWRLIINEFTDKPRSVIPLSERQNELQCLIDEANK